MGRPVKLRNCFLRGVDVVSRSMKELRIKVPRTELSGARNLKELLDLFEKSAGSASAG
jgi:hypothetical protein